MTVVYVNLGDSVTVAYPNKKRGVPLLHGDTVAYTLPEDMFPLFDQEMAERYLDVVPMDSMRAKRWRQEKELATAIAQAAWEAQRKRAEAWLAEHDVPEFVIDYLREGALSDY